MKQIEKSMTKSGQNEKNIGCVIMASGLSRRFGKENKLLSVFQGRTLIQRILDTITACQNSKYAFHRIVVVTRTKEVADLCKKQRISFIYHELPNRSDTICLGVEQMNGMDACVFCPCDQPFLSAESILHLNRTFIEKRDGIIRLGYEEKAGTPVLFGKEFFHELANLPAGKGGGYLIQKYPHLVSVVQAENEMELYDIDTKEDCQWLTEYSKNKNISAKD